MRICLFVLLSFISLNSVFSQAVNAYLRDLEQKLDLLCEEYKILNPAPNNKSLIKSRTLTYNPLTATYWTWNDVEKNWLLHHKELCTYNPANHLLELINKSWNEDQWKDEYRALFVYTQDQLLRLFQYENWENHDWHLYTRYVNEYDAEDRLISVNLEDWIGKEWIVRSRKLHAYYDQPNCRKTTDQLQDNHEWINDKRETSYFDAQQQTKSMVQEEWNGVNWEKSFRQQFNYDASYRLSSILGQTWSAEQWIDATQTTLLYDENSNLITQEIHLLQPSAGQQDFAWHLQYDDSNRLIETALWIKDGNTWNVKSRNLYTYDHLDRILTNQSQVYEYAWFNADYISYTYKDLTNIEDDHNDLRVCIFPNPTLDLLYVEFPEEISAATLQLVNMDGRIISSTSLSNTRETQLDMSPYPPGQYSIRILMPHQQFLRNFSKN